MAKVLVVDDSEKIQKLVQSILVQAEHDVILAPDAYEAMDKLDKYQFDLMILDVNMPYKDGLSALQSLRQKRRFKMLPVILLTARNGRRDIERAAQLDVSSYIIKPIAKDDFIEKVNKALGKPKKRKLEVKVPNGYQLASGKIVLTSECQITRITEIGVDTVCEQQFTEGKQLKLNSPLFSHIGIDTPLMCVVSVQESTDGFITKMSFAGLPAESLQLLRNWLLSDKPFSRAA